MFSTLCKARAPFGEHELCITNCNADDYAPGKFQDILEYRDNFLHSGAAGAFDQYRGANQRIVGKVRSQFV